MQDITSIKSFLNGYLDFLKDHSSEVRVSENVSKITLPFLDGLNDCTEIYIKIEKENEFIITDNGYTISNLEFFSVSFSSSTKQAILKRIINSYGVLMADTSLYVRATNADLFLKKHMLLQCIAKLNDMYMLNRDNVQNIFLEEVREFFDKSDIYYVPNHRLTGLSGLTANYDFALPKIRQRPFTLIKTLNSLNINSVKSTVFDWTDTKDAGEDEKSLLVIYNDTTTTPKDDSLTALVSYNIESFPWSKRDGLRRKLSA